MRTCFFTMGMLFVLGFGMSSCENFSAEKADKTRSKIKINQWKADSIAARKLIEELHPDTTLSSDSLRADSTQTDSLLH